LSCSGVFVLLPLVKPSPRIPLLLAGSVIVLLCLLQDLRIDALEQLEARTFDARARLAARFPTPTATNLGFVFISDASIARLKDGSLEDAGGRKFRYGLYWPRHIYGRVLRELAAQGATAVGYDVLFAETRPDHAPILVATNTEPSLENFLAQLHPGETPFLSAGEINVESDDFFAWQLHRAGIASIAANQGVLPHARFRNHAAVADIAARPDSDGVLRRARAFTEYRRWHPIFEQAAREYGLDLERADIQPRQLTLATAGGEKIKIPRAADGTFDPVDFGGAAAAKIPRAQPFTTERIWQMGIALAARQLGLDLTRAEVDLPRGQITLRGPGGLTRTIPVDTHGYFPIDWQLPPNDPRLTREPFENLLALDHARALGQTNDLPERWRGKLVVIGSTASGNDLTDRGATPLEHDTVLMSKHWNVANAVLTDRFIRRTTPAQDLLLLVLLGALAAALTLRLPTLTGSLAILATIGLYLGVALLLYVQQRCWLPVFLPIVGALITQHGCLVTWRAVFEQAEKRRVRSVFSRIIAPEVVSELLAADTVALNGIRREITIFFADVRGFTAFTDASRDAAIATAREKNLSPAAAEALFDLEARESIQTINAYLALVADQIKAHGGTLDKYIGDCVMAFWNAPGANPQHTLQCVRAAIAAQRAIDDLNRHRAALNDTRELENLQRAASGQPPLPPLPILTLGIGINTGPAIVGLMGSDAHLLNYTAFGREVNLASRLESLSGRGRILIGETTFAAIRRADPALAATCTALAPANLKGIRESVNVFEVAWRLPGTISPVIDDYGSASSFATSVTGMFRKS